MEDGTNSDYIYETKHRHLLDYYKHIFQMNNRMRHRIYHVKKEINHLKQLKRVLCERLLLHRAVIIDSNLEIPDNDSNVIMMDKIIGEVVNTEQQQKADTSGSGRKRKQKVEGAEEQPQKNIPNKRRKTKEDTKRNIISIIESIVADTHKDSQKQESQPAETIKKCDNAEKHGNEHVESIDCAAKTLSNLKDKILEEAPPIQMSEIKQERENTDETMTESEENT